MGRSFGHAARRFTDREADRLDRWGEVCAVSAKCAGRAVILTSADYVTGRRGRVSTRDVRACETHGAKFAAKNGITIAAAPTVEPGYRPGILTVVAGSAAAAPPARVKAEPHSPGTWVITCYGSGAQLIAGVAWLNIADGTPVDQVLAAAERTLARERGVVLTDPWTPAGRGFTAHVTRAEETLQWAGKPWGVVVHENDPGRYDDRRVWCADVTLDPQFAGVSFRLGHTNMNLARAVTTAQQELTEVGWVLGEWTLLGDLYATTTATRAEETHDRV